MAEMKTSIRPCVAMSTTLPVAARESRTRVFPANRPGWSLSFVVGPAVFAMLSCLMLLGQAETPARGEDRPVVDPAAQPESQPKLPELLEHLRQLGDDAVDPTPLPLPDEQTQNGRKARALYMSGRVFEQDKKFREAYEAYREALSLDPNSLTLHRALIPLAFRLEKTEEAITLARRAVELDPNNFELLSQLGIYALRQQDLQGSIDFFQKAVKSQTVDKKSGQYVSIMSQLGQLYLSIGDNERAAEAYETVFDALTQPDAYRLDFRTVQALESIRGTKAETFESFGELFLATSRLEKAEAAFLKAQDASRGKRAVFSYQLARVLTKKQDFPAAEAKLQEYFEAKLNQKGRGPYLLLAELLREQNQADQITARLEHLAQQDPENQDLRLYLAERYVVDDRLDDAEEIYETYKEDGSNKGEIYLGLLQIHRKRNQPEKALQALTQAMMNGANNERLEAELELLAQNAELADAMIELGLEQQEGDKRELFSQAYLVAKLAMQRKNYEAVIDFYQRAMEIRQERQILLTLYNELIQFLIAEEQYELTIDVLEEAIDNPGLAQVRQAFQLQLIRVLAQDKKTEQALEVVRIARESDPENLLWQYQEGWIYYIAENWEEAIKLLGPVLEKAVEQDNEGIEREVRYNLSRCLAFAGLVNEALELMTQSLDQQPENLLWQYQKGWVYYYSHQWGKAIEEFQKLIAREDQAENKTLVRQAKFSLSAAYVQNEQFDEGEQILEAIYEQDPDDISVCNDLGYLYADRDKKLDQAHEMIRKAVKAEPDNHAYLDSLGWVLYRLGRYEEARKHLEQAVQDSEQGDAVLWDHLGDCYHKLNLTEKARQAWNTALEHERKEKFSNQKLIQQIEQKLK